MAHWADDADTGEALLRSRIVELVSTWVSVTRRTPVVTATQNVAIFRYCLEPWSAEKRLDGQRQRVDAPGLPMPELPTMTSRRKT